MKPYALFLGLMQSVTLSIHSPVVIRDCLLILSQTRYQHEIVDQIVGRRHKIIVGLLLKFQSI